MKKVILSLIFLSLIVSSCTDSDDKSDAYGNFEAVEITVSAEANGKLLEFNVEEGQTIDEGEIVGYIDTVQLNLKKQQLDQQKNTVRTKYNNVFSQVSVLQQEKNNALIEKNRIEKLIKDEAAPEKQLDDINARINVIDKQIASVQSQNSTTFQEVKTIDTQIDQLTDQINKSEITNPIKGTVLIRFSEPSEIVNYGKPLYKIADLSIMELRVYVSGDQLPSIKIGQEVTVIVDKNKEENRTLKGTISWISSKAEFTPKIIQTKEERVNLVYAVKVSVNNDGTLKIGMPGEIMFNMNQKSE
ncbi:MAG: HlyD family efflux transporter periplasmic adaptor subunit [Ignavibacteria bacterium]|nr:HlyD family efflux transporter periplasmic adaptor subunit [Ignavibacteria bacterium]